MLENRLNFEYQIGGSLAKNAPSYVTRKADSVFYEALKAGEFCYVLNSRQMGKSSLRVRTMQRLANEGFCCAFIDLTEIGIQGVTPDKWYAGIVQLLVSSCELNIKLSWRTWWRERLELFSPVQRLSQFIREILLVEVKEKIVIFIDEVDLVLSQPFSLDDFFALIRFCFEERKINPDYERITFALLGVATPSDLIKDKMHTPFNIGRAIELQGFTFSEVQPLVEGLQGKVNYPQAVMKEILQWTGGQPFLTQKICQLMVNSSTEQNTPGVEEVIRLQVIANWESTDEPEHLRTIRNRILTNEQRAVQFLGLYQQILEQGAIAANGSQDQQQLRLCGLVVERLGQLTVYNRIYANIFNQQWVEQRLAEIRPYAVALASWLASSGQDQSQLLQGAALQSVLTWTLGKSLSEADYQFLVACQELEQQRTKTALETLEQASRLLAEARQKARSQVLKRRIGKPWLFGVMLMVVGIIFLLRFGGWLQGLEWNLLDQCFRWRSPEPMERRIALVTIDESDLTAVGQWPIPDQVLAQTIAQIKSQNPRSIGLDLYRNLPVEPGHEQLLKLFESTSNLFGVEKVVKNPIAPPAVLKGREQIGFVDQVLDSDGKVRRALLSVADKNGKVELSLAVKLALHYLTTQGVTWETAKDNPYRVRLGKAVIERFEKNDGGYVNAQSGGYQILLNFRGNQEQFVNFSLQQVLSNQVPPGSFSDRIILIGTTAESLNDFFFTPYSSTLFASPVPMAGITLHANIVSQMISAAMDGRPMLRVWSESLEWLWVLIWAMIGTLISWWFKAPLVIAIMLILWSMGLIIMGHSAFLLGWWLPVIPPLLSLLGSALVLLMISNKQLDQLQFHRTVTTLLQDYQNSPTAARIALEYLKQSETKERQAFLALTLSQLHQIV
ncbi:CHASE2 domain-containing protein [Gloeothece verrucosa]|uniref:Putative Chase2 sensor protein n=1 Tax=Gloeothece verrucosa (strain PCC 7822) TaxID=497965 RepID=E0UI80_GLOV7|nr:CHASE2 domain-containing protein [Gloeothece verrucosa]ADN15732.1 putative Chase2 sensor protein [Gloeothece verrucosa PCC 7822]